ncbi:hypothetical protein A3Q56_04237, partial [Intoshia linei]
IFSSLKKIFVCNLTGKELMIMLRKLNIETQKTELLITEFNCPKVEFIKALNDFKLVVQACFGTVLAIDYKIENFRKSYLNLNIRITPKLHAVFFHIADFYDQKNSSLAIGLNNVNIIFKHSYKDNDFIEFDLIVADDQYSIFYNENKLEMYRNHKFCNLNYFLNILNNHLSELNMCTENNKIQKTEYVFFRKVKNEICQLIENYCKLNWKSISDRQKHQDLYIRENYFTDNLRVFYKSSDEQNIYLDKLEVNMIKCQFNSFFDYPKIISVNINRLKTYLLTKVYI